MKSDKVVYLYLTKVVLLTKFDLAAECPIRLTLQRCICLPHDESVSRNDSDLLRLENSYSSFQIQ